MLALVTALAIGIKPLTKWVSNCYGETVSNQFEKEEKERQQKVTNGEIVRGKDTVLIWENMYEIGHYADGNRLEMFKGGLTDTILEKISKYKVVEGKLFIISEEGFAIVDKNNLCRVFVTVPTEEFVNGYSVDEQGNKCYYTRFLEDEHVKYLSELNEFSEEEQEVFSKL